MPHCSLPIDTDSSHAALRSNVRKRIFDNLDDTEDDLRALLGGAFAHVDIELVGAMALFRASGPVAVR